MISRIATLALVVVLSGASMAYGQDGTRDLEATIPADQIMTIVVDASVGNIRLRGTNQNNVQIDLHLKAKRSFGLFSGSTYSNLDGVELRAETRGSELRVSLSGERKNITEEWTITVPVRLRARIDLDVGEVEVAGLSGGCEARVNVGSVKVNVPEGNVLAVADVGEVEVNSATNSYGQIKLSSDIGETDVVLNGRRIGDQRSSFIGSNTSLTGSGRDRIELRANIGSAKLTIR